MQCVSLGYRCLFTCYVLKKRMTFFLKLFGKGLTQCQLFWHLRMFRFWLLILVLSAMSGVLSNFYLTGSCLSLFHLFYNCLTVELLLYCMVAIDPFIMTKSTTSNSPAISCFDTWIRITVTKERGQLLFMAHVVHPINANTDHYGCCLACIYVGHQYSHYRPHASCSQNFLKI